MHLNQVNVGTNVTVSHMSYQRWCTLTRVNTCTTLNMCAKHKKQCSKKEGSDAKNKNCVDDMALPLHVGGLPKHAKIHQFPPPKPVHPESVEIPVLQHSQAEALNGSTSRLFPMRSN